MKIFKENIGLTFYSIVLFILCFGVCWMSGVKYLDKLVIIIVSTYVSYFLFKRYLPIDRFKLQGLKMNVGERGLTYGLFALGIGIFILDVIFSRGLPILQLTSQTTLSEFNDLRANVYELTPKFQIYLSGWNLKAILPFTLLVLYLKGKKQLFYILLITSCFYALAMLQKSYILNLLTPLIILLLIKKEYLKTSVFLLISTVIIFTLVGFGSKFKQKSDTKSHNNTTEIKGVDAQNKYNAPVRYTIGIARRIMVVPGEMVSGWFDVIPSKVPFLYGNGYRLISKLRGTEYHDYSSELYPLLRPSFISRGLTGTVNVASFMRGYSNFGVPGLIVSCVFISLFLFLLEYIFSGNKKIFIALNAYPILLLSSGNILTLLLSGGWIITILLMICFSNYLNDESFKD